VKTSVARIHVLRASTLGGRVNTPPDGRKRLGQMCRQIHRCIHGFDNARANAKFQNPAGNPIESRRYNLSRPSVASSRSNEIRIDLPTCSKSITFVSGIRWRRSQKPENPRKTIGVRIHNSESVRTTPKAFFAPPRRVSSESCEHPEAKRSR
jgi:hypothetical protein